VAQIQPWMVDSRGVSLLRMQHPILSLPIVTPCEEGIVSAAPLDDWEPATCETVLPRDVGEAPYVMCPCRRVLWELTLCPR
jgi:hypothetical protein